MIHQKQYEWLSKETSPKVIVEAVNLYGTREIVGKQHSKEILSWAEEVGLGKVYKADETAWCFDKETTVTTLDGYKFIKDIKEGLDFVFTRENEFHLVNKLLTRKKTLHKVYATGIMPFLVTSDHPFLIKKCIKYSSRKPQRVFKEELEWVKFKDIQKGDLLCKLKTNLVVNSPLDEYNKYFIQLLGTYAAEGTYRKFVKGDKKNNIKCKTASCSIHIGKHELLKIKDLIIKAGLQKYTITERRTCYQIEIREKDFVSYCSEIGHKGIEKKIPYFILNGTEHVKFSFLKGYLDGDGYYNEKNKRGSASSISKLLILGVGKLLTDSGIFPTFREELREGTMVIEGRTVNVKNRYIIQYVNNLNNAKQYLEDDKYFYLPIRKIKHDFKEDLVYDLEVDKVSNFLANDLVVHNCGLYTAVVVKRAGFDIVKDPLWARNWNNFGTKQDVAMLGDILIFVRDGGGHVGFYVGEDATCYHVLGGNQSNMVNTTRILKSRCIGIRRCPWKTIQPINVRVVELAASGIISTNEA